MIESKNPDLLERTLAFAQDIRAFLRRVPRTIANIEDGKQLIRSSGSVGANYIEAREAISKKDYLHRVKICRKESKESGYWLQLLCFEHRGELERERQRLILEARQFVLMFSAIVSKASKS
ncbi:MAG: four helix bundle protein [Candidatus Peregrinibacteria bacterium]